MACYRDSFTFYLTVSSTIYVLMCHEILMYLAVSTVVRSSLVHSPAYNDLVCVLIFFEYYNTKSADILKSCFNVEKHRLYTL
jgi:hypothetical protein